MEYYCDVCTGTPNCDFNILDELQKRVNIVVGSLAVSLDLLTHCQHVASLRLLCRYFFVRCSSELASKISNVTVPG